MTFLKNNSQIYLKLQKQILKKVKIDLNQDQTLSTVKIEPLPNSLEEEEVILKAYIYKKHLSQAYQNKRTNSSQNYLMRVQFLVRAFDGNLCETKDEALKKYQSRVQVDYLSRPQQSAQSQSQAGHSKRISSFIQQQRQSLRLDDDEDQFPVDVDEVNLQQPSAQNNRMAQTHHARNFSFNQIKAKAFSHHYRNRSNQFKRNYQHQTLLNNFPQCIIDNPQEKLLNNKTFHRITHSSQNTKKPQSQIDITKLQGLPTTYERVFSNKSQYGINLYKTAQSNSVKDDLELQMINQQELQRNKKDVYKIEQQCLMSIDNHRSSVRNKNQLFFEFLPEDLEDVMGKLDKEIRCNMVFKQSEIIKSMEKKHVKRMRRFKESVGHKGNNIQNFTDVGTRFIKTQEFRKGQEKEQLLSARPHLEEDDSAQLIDGAPGGRRQKLREHLNKFLVNRKYDPLLDENEQPMQDNVIKIDCGKRGSLLYTQESLKKLLDNDTLKYEESEQAVYDEFQHYSIQTYYYISNRHKNGMKRH